MNLRAALDDADLFGPMFRGPTWDAWRAFISAMFALPMTPAELATFRHHTGRQAAPMQPFTEAALICGRRGGKSRVLALLGVFLATFVDYRDRLAPGELGTVAIIAADRVQARGIFRYVMGMLRNVPLLAPLIEAETAESVTLSNGIIITVATNSYRLVRGTSLVAALCDEVAFWRSDESANPDFDTLAALRPGLANLGGLLLLASSPYAQRGALYQAFRDHYGRDDASVLVWRGTSREMNPGLPQSVVDAAMQADPANAASEYLAQFRTDIAAWIERRHLEAVTFPGRFELPHMHGQKYVAFCDPSGGVSDSMTLAVAHREGDIAILDCIRVRRAPFNPDDAVAEFADVLASYGLRTVAGDRYGGTWPATAFKNAGITYTASERDKSTIYKEALPVIMRGGVELLDHTVLMAEMCSLERRVGRGGRDSVDHPAHGGAHDDVANAACGAVLLAAGKVDGGALWAALAA